MHMNRLVRDTVQNSIAYGESTWSDSSLQFRVQIKEQEAMCISGRVYDCSNISSLFMHFTRRRDFFACMQL